MLPFSARFAELHYSKEFDGTISSTLGYDGTRRVFNADHIVEIRLVKPIYTLRRKKGEKVKPRTWLDKILKRKPTMLYSIYWVQESIVETAHIKMVGDDDIYGGYFVALADLPEHLRNMIDEENY